MMPTVNQPVTSDLLKPRLACFQDVDGAFSFLPPLWGKPVLSLSKGPRWGSSSWSLAVGPLTLALSHEGRGDLERIAITFSRWVSLAPAKSPALRAPPFVKGGIEGGFSRRDSRTKKIWVNPFENRSNL